MSYTIIFNKCFIKATKDENNVYFPMVLGGSSNCVDSNNKIARDWYVHSILNGKKYGTAEEIMQAVALRRQETINSNEDYRKRCEELGNPNLFTEYSDDAWGYFIGLAIGSTDTHKTTFRTYANLFKKGIQNALTVEKLRELGVSINVSSWIYFEDRAKFEAAGKTDISFTPLTSEELVKRVDEVVEYLKDIPYAYVNIKMNISDYEIERIKELSRKSRTVATPKSVDEYFVIKFESSSVNGYFVKQTSRGINYSFQYYGAKKFASAKAAEIRRKKLSEKMGATFVTTVENIKETAKI